MARLPTWKELRRFCAIDEWSEKVSARGRTPDHYRFWKRLSDGRNLTTKASHGSGGIEDPAMWASIWKHQLALDQEQDFWDCLSSGKPVKRATITAPAPPDPPAERLDYGLVRKLRADLGMSPHEAVKLTKEEAIRRLREAQD